MIEKVSKRLENGQEPIDTTLHNNSGPDLGLELEILARASNLVLRRHDPEYQLSEVLDRLLEQLQLLVPYDSATIHRLDVKEESLKPIIVRGMYAENFVETQIPLHRSIIGTAIINREVMHLPDAEDIKHLGRAQIAPAEPQSMMVAPVAVDEQGGGWVLCARRFSGAGFSSREFQHFKIISNYADAAIQNSQLYEAAIRDAKVLREVNQIMQTVSAALEDPIEICNRLATGVSEILEYERLSIFRINKEEGTIFTKFSSRTQGSGRQEPRTSLKGSVVEYVTRTGKSLVRNDTTDIVGQHFTEDTRLSLEGVRSYIILPMYLEDQHNGAVLLTSYWPDYFNSMSISFMEILTVQFATVIQNALLFERLSQTRHEWQLTLDAIPDAMMLVDARNFNIIQANYGAATMAGRQPDELIGRTCREIFYMVDPCLTTFPLEEMKPSGEGYTEEKAGTVSGRIYQRSVYPIYADGQLSELVVHIRDITESKLLTQQLAENARLKAVGEMASGIAHDFNNSLAGILGNVELMLLEAVEPQLIKQLKQLQRAAIDSTNTVKRIQSFGKRDNKQSYHIFNLSEVTTEVIELTRPRWQNQSAQKGIYIGMVQKLSSKVEVWGNPSEIKEVITNLLFNAIDAMPNGGTVTISSRIEREEKGSKRKRLAVLEVNDTGTGIPQDVQDHIFEAFFTTKGKGGTGLGLARVYTVITEHEGEVSFDTNQGKGTTFRVKLQTPATDTNPTAIAPAPSKPQETPEPTEPAVNAQILVIDDDPQLSNILQRILVVLGHSVVRAGSGAEGIEHLQTHKPGFDMVFTDLSMPEMSGYEVAKAVKAFDNRIVVAFITGWGNDLDRDNLESRGVDLLIAKPYRIEEVRDLVKNAMEIRQKYLHR